MRRTSRRHIVKADASRYIESVLRILRAGLLTLVVLGLSLAGPVQANCAPPPTDAAVPCSSMAMDEEGPEQPRPDVPTKVCAIFQCPTAPPAVAEAESGVAEPVSHAARPMMVPGRTLASADPAPEQRPPIS